MQKALLVKHLSIEPPEQAIKASLNFFLRNGANQQERDKAVLTPADLAVKAAKQDVVDGFIVAGFNQDKTGAPVVTQQVQSLEKDMPSVVTPALPPKPATRISTVQR